jgi:hypothetical protein
MGIEMLGKRKHITTNNVLLSYEIILLIKALLCTDSYTNTNFCGKICQLECFLTVHCKNIQILLWRSHV